MSTPTEISNPSLIDINDKQRKQEQKAVRVTAMQMALQVTPDPNSVCVMANNIYQFLEYGTATKEATK
tara:strand:+ start:287 stop:490 length:204 start_codon:yes stop_codon:yes gene_type:complete